MSSCVHTLIRCRRVDKGPWPDMPPYHNAAVGPVSAAVVRASASISRTPQPACQPLGQENMPFSGCQGRNSSANLHMLIDLQVGRSEGTDCRTCNFTAIRRWHRPESGARLAGRHLTLTDRALLLQRCAILIQALRHSASELHDFARVGRGPRPTRHRFEGLTIRHDEIFRLQHCPPCVQQPAHLAATMARQGAT